MAAFEYEAIDSSGAKATGILEADNSIEARQDLRDMGLIPIDVVAVTQKLNPNLNVSRQPRIAGEALAIITRQLATLLDSGLPMDESLSSVSRQSSRSAQKILSDLRSQVREGQALANAMESYPRTFSSLYRASVQAGEASGNLASVMTQLASYLEERAESGKKIALALVYPALLLFVSISVVSGLLIWVIPGIIEVISDSGQELPMLTLGLIKLSDFVVDYGLYLILLIVLCWMGVLGLYRIPKFKRAIDLSLLKIPGLAGSIKEQASAKYAGTLGILTSSGISLVDAMTIAEKISTNTLIAQQHAELTQQVRDGAQLARSMERSRLFNPMVVQLVSVGEQSGSLAAMLLRASKVQEDILQRRTATFVALFEPLTLLIMGAVVLAIVLAVMLPILNFNQLL